MSDANPIVTEDRIAEQTKLAMAKGVDLFQIFRLHDDPAEHVRLYLEFATLPQYARVVDMGAGIGGMTAKMKVLRPDLRCVLVNNNHFQYETSKLKIRDNDINWFGNMTDTGLPPQYADAVLYNYSLGYVDPCEAFREAARILKHGGSVIVWDLEGDSLVLAQDTGYQVREDYEIRTAIRMAGLHYERVLYPEGCSIREFQSVCPEYLRRFCTAILPNVRPVLMRLTLTGGSRDADRPAAESLTGAGS